MNEIKWLALMFVGVFVMGSVGFVAMSWKEVQMAKIKSAEKCVGMNNEKFTHVVVRPSDKVVFEFEVPDAGPPVKK